MISGDKARLSKGPREGGEGEKSLRKQHDRRRAGRTNRARPRAQKPAFAQGLSAIAQTPENARLKEKTENENDPR